MISKSFAQLKMIDFTLSSAKNTTANPFSFIHSTWSAKTASQTLVSASQGVGFGSWECFLWGVQVSTIFIGQMVEAVSQVAAGMRCVLARQRVVKMQLLQKQNKVLSHEQLQSLIQQQEFLKQFESDRVVQRILVLSEIMDMALLVFPMLVSRGEVIPPPIIISILLKSPPSQARTWVKKGGFLLGVGFSIGY